MDRNKLLLLVLVLVFMGMMLFFSSQNGSVSNGLSDTVAGHVAQILGWSDISGQNLEPINHLVRKVAHLIEYLVLSILLCNLFTKLSARIMPGILTAWIVSIFFSLVDEWIQIGSPGRTSSMNDVFIDAAGISLGILLYMLIEREELIDTYKSWRW